MVVNFKKNSFGKDDYDPADDETYTSEEIQISKVKDGKVSYKLPKDDKDDKEDPKNETSCKMTKFYLTLTNLLDPAKPAQSSLLETPRMLQSAPGSIATLSAVAEEPENNSVFMTFTALLSFTLIISLFAF